jgi:hypothetical protein
VFVLSDVLKDRIISEFRDIALLFWFVHHFVAYFKILGGVHDLL